MVLLSVYVTDNHSSPLPKYFILPTPVANQSLVLATITGYPLSNGYVNFDADLELDADSHAEDAFAFKYSSPIRPPCLNKRCWRGL